MRSIPLFALALAALTLALAGCGGDDVDSDDVAAASTAVESVAEEVSTAAEEAAGEGLAVQLNEQNGSGESGTATLSVGDGGTLEVELELDGAPAGTPQPAHIHPGTCADLDPVPKYPLENVVDGSSQTSVDVSLEDLALEVYAINVHKSAEEADVYVACGDIGDITP
jgi:hypothetical protein